LVKSSQQNVGKEKEKQGMKTKEFLSIGVELEFLWGQRCAIWLKEKVFEWSPPLGLAEFEDWGGLREKERSEKEKNWGEHARVVKGVEMNL